MSRKPLVLNILFKGDSVLMSEEDEYLREFKLKGLLALTIPPLKFKFKNIPDLLHLLQEPRAQSKGLIITSPRVVQAIEKALQLVDETTRKRITESFSRDLVFVVGQKTASECIKIGLDCNQESASSGNSNNLAVFIKSSVNKHVSLVYPKGSLANNFLEKELAIEKGSIMRIETVVVYETVKTDHLLQMILEKLEKFSSSGLRRQQEEVEDVAAKVVLNVIFFSPSGVEAFAGFDREELVSKLRHLFSRHQIELLMSAIGETTKARLESNNYHCFCVAQKPNATSLVECVIEQLNKLD